MGSGTIVYGPPKWGSGTIVYGPPKWGSGTIVYGPPKWGSGTIWYVHNPLAMCSEAFSSHCHMKIEMSSKAFISTMVTLLTKCGMHVLHTET